MVALRKLYQVMAVVDAYVYAANLVLFPTIMTIRLIEATVNNFAPLDQNTMALLLTVGLYTQQKNTNSIKYDIGRLSRRYTKDRKRAGGYLPHDTRATS